MYQLTMTHRDAITLTMSYHYMVKAVQFGDFAIILVMLHTASSSAFTWQFLYK